CLRGRRLRYKAGRLSQGSGCHDDQASARGDGCGRGGRHGDRPGRRARGRGHRHLDGHARGKFYTFADPATPHLTAATTSARFPCRTDFGISGTLNSGTGLADPIGTIATAKGRAGSPLTLQCTGNGLELTMTFSGLPWPVRALRYDSASPGTTS